MLASKTKYKAVVTTGAKDVAGNVLDQNPSTVGTQEKVWYFTTGRRSRRAPCSSALHSPMTPLHR